MTRFKLTLAGFLALAQAPAMATALIDGGFETKGAALPVNSYCYDNQNAGDGFCAASPWVNLASNSGVIRSGNGAWGGVVADEGDYYGFIQVAGVLAQSFTATANGTGTVSWIDRNRAGYGGLQSYDVSIFNGVTSVNIGSFATAVGPWVARTSAVFALTSGTTYSLRFTGLAVSDSTAFIDNVSLATIDVPEPASWAMMIAGFGLTGAAMRRRRAVLA
jgi:hypothetical protein